MTEIFDDIRKLYTFKAPCEELKNYIEFFSETSADATYQHIHTEKFTVKLFPSYTPTIWLNLGSPYHLKNGYKEFFIDAHSDILLLRNDIVERTNLRTDNIFTVKFHPGGFEAVFGIEQKKIGSEIINVNTIIAPDMLHKLKRGDCFEDRMVMLQNYFLHLLNKKFVDNYFYKKVVHAVTKYQQTDMACSSKTIATQLSLSDKTFYRYFTNVVGVSPKNYFTILRARTALPNYVNNKTKFSPYDYGYYDMSHFRKEVLKFTGEKLSAWQW
jgi:AraC-like DNA-binding protein